MISLLENNYLNKQFIINKTNQLTNQSRNQLINQSTNQLTDQLYLMNLLLKMINNNKYDNCKFNKIKNNILIDSIKNKNKYEITIFLNTANQISNEINIEDLKLLKNIGKLDMVSKLVLKLSFETIYNLIIEEKIRQCFIKINLNKYWDESLFGKINKNRIKYIMIDNNLILLLNNKSFIIMYGNKQGCSGNTNVFEPTNIIYKASKGKNTIINQKSNGSTKNIYEESNGVIVKNDIKMGIGKPENKIVWKVANILGTKNNCIIKLRLLESSKFIRPIDLEYIFRGKCRCDSAYVEEIQEYNFNEEKQIENVIGMGIKGFKYEVGKNVYSDDWNDDIYTSCTHGIHVLEKREDLEKFMCGVNFNIENSFEFDDV
jgi:hypothetical protein